MKIDIDSKLDNIKLNFSKNKIDKDTALLSLEKLISQDIPKLKKGQKRHNKNKIFKLKREVRKR